MVHKAQNRRQKELQKEPPRNTLSVHQLVHLPNVLQKVHRKESIVCVSRPMLWLLTQVFM